VAADRRVVVLLGLSAVLYVALRVLAFQRGVATGGDTQSYDDASHLPLFSVAFLAGQRALFTPLVWKILRNHEAIVLFQLAFSIVSWSTLAFGIAAMVRSRWVKLLALWLVFGLSLSTPITEWDHYLLSDSLSISLLALLAGIALLMLQRPTWIGLGTAIVVALAWTMTRDTNAYAAVVIAIALALVLVFRRHAIVGAALAATVAVFGVSVADAAHGHRADPPIRDTIWLRLQADNPSGFQWIYWNWNGLYGSKTPGVYRTYLLHHPLYTLGQPLESAKTSATFSSPDRLTALYTPQLAGYDSESVRGTHPHYYRWRIPRSVQNVFWPHRPGRLGLELLVVLAIALVAIALRRGRDWRFAVALVVILAVYPQLVVVWHFSGQEVDRHALTPATEVRIGMALMLAIAVDVIACALAAREQPANSQETARSATP